MSGKFTWHPGEDQTQAWKRALAEHRKQLRNRRGKRPPKPIVGVVILPAATTAQHKPDHADD